MPRLISPISSANETALTFRQAKVARVSFSPYAAPSSSSTDIFNPGSSQYDIPLKDSTHQHWDDQGKAVGFVPNPNFIFAPKPKVHEVTSLPLRDSKDEEDVDNALETGSPSHRFPPGL